MGLSARDGSSGLLFPFLTEGGQKDVSNRIAISLKKICHQKTLGMGRKK
jgi:hypothetical protein